MTDKNIKALNDTLTAYQQKIDELKKRSLEKSSHEMDDNIKELEKQHAVIKDNVSKLEQAEDAAHAELHKGIDNAVGLFTKVLDSIDKD